MSTKPDDDCKEGRIMNGVEKAIAQLLISRQKHDEAPCSSDNHLANAVYLLLKVCPSPRLDKELGDELEDLLNSNGFTR